MVHTACTSSKKSQFPLGLETCPAAKRRGRSSCKAEKESAAGQKGAAIYLGDLGGQSLLLLPQLVKVRHTMAPNRAE